MKMEQHLFENIKNENQSQCWGIFADGDTFGNCKDEFAQHFTQFNDLHGEHCTNNQVIRDIIIHAVKRILKE